MASENLLAAVHETDNTPPTWQLGTFVCRRPAVVIEKTRIPMEGGVKPEIAAYTDV